jgi:hypothetical protein
VDRYVLSLGTSSGAYDASREITISVQAATRRSDGSLSYDIQLDRSRDQYLSMRAAAGSQLSPPSNELRVPALQGAASATAAVTGASATAVASSASLQPAAAMRSAASAPFASGSDLTSAARTSLASGAEGALESAATTAPAAASLDLNGSDEFLASTEAAAFETRDWTVSLWGKVPLGDSGRRGLLRLACVDDTCAVELSLVYAAGGPVFELRAYDAPSNEAAWRSPAPILPGVWWHLAVAFDPVTATARVYVDGELVAEHPGADFIAALTAVPLRVTLGATDGRIGPWRGRLGHSAIFARALGPEEITELSIRGHEVDLRADLGAYHGAAALAHYWRLGALAATVGLDFVALPLDLNDPAGNVAADDVVADAPGSLAP